LAFRVRNILAFAVIAIDGDLISTDLLVFQRIDAGISDDIGKIFYILYNQSENN
jgi:hypothetical protein